MNVQIENIMPEGFVYEKVHNVMHGAVNGIALLIVPIMAENQFRIQLHGDIERSGKKENFLEFLKVLDQRHPFVRYAGYNGRNTVTIQIDSMEQEDKENLTIIASEITSKCMECGIPNCCSRCKNVLPLRAAAVDGMPALLCENCFTQEMSGANGQGIRKENVFLGFIGAVGGALLGTALWVAIGMVGFIAGIAGYAIVFCGMKGYEMLGKKLSRKGIVICIVLSCLMILGAEYISLGFSIYKELGTEYYLSLLDSFSLVPALLEEPEIVGGVIKDLIFGYGLAIWACFSSVRLVWRQVQQEQKPHTVVPL